MAEQFSWASALDVGIGAAGGLLKWFASRDQNIAAEAARESRNIVNASKNSLAATVRSINNQRLMEAAAKQVEAEGINLSRIRDAAASRRFEQSIRNQESAGARAANIAASGVGGVALSAVSGAMELQFGRLEFQARQQEGQLAYNSIARMSGFVPDAIGAQDRSMIGGNMDFVRSTNAQGSMLGLFTSLAAGALSKKDSLQVMLGSLEPGRGATATPVTQPVAEPTELPQIISTPIPNRTVTGYDLPSMEPLVSRATSKTIGGV